MNFPGQNELTFTNYGGVYQLRVETLEDLRHLSTLDDPHWMATSAPVHQLRADPSFLEHMDSDGNDRIISSDLRRVAAWLFQVLQRTDGISDRAEGLALADVNPEDPAGAAILETARRVLENLGKKDAETITLDDVRNQKKIMAKGDGNGDGVIPPGSVDDEEVDALITDVMHTIGVVQDVSGEEGIDEAHLDSFLDAASAFLEWKRSVEEDDSGSLDLMHPLGEGTAEAYDLLMELAPKIDEWFALSRLEALNTHLKRDVAGPRFDESVYQDADERDAYMAAAPIALPVASQEFSFNAPLNPHYDDLLRVFQDKVYIPVVGDGQDHEVMSEATWRNLKLVFDAYGAWRDSKSGEQVERLGAETLQGYLDGEVTGIQAERSNHHRRNQNSGQADAKPH